MFKPVSSAAVKKFTISAGDLMSCLRGVYYKKKKFPLPLVHPEIAKTWELWGRLAEMGQEVQKRVTSEWRSQGILLSPERFIPWNDYGITGKYDAIVKVDGNPVLYEIKRGGKFILGLAKPEPYDEHRLQAIIYHYFLKRNFPNLTVRVLYVERGGELRKIEIPLEYLEDEILSVIEKAKKFKEFFEKGVLPEPMEAIVLSKFTKKYEVSMKAIACKYHGLCLGDDHWYEKAFEEAGKKNASSK